MSFVEVARHGAVAVVTLCDPERRNLLSIEMCSALSEAVASLSADEEVHALIITGAGSAFCAGADLADLEAAAAEDGVSLEPVYRAFLDVAECPLPTIAAINGPAVGAGLNLALACDIRIAADRAWFDTRFLAIGLHPGGGHGWMLLRAVGWAEASRMLLTGARVTATEALDIGLIQRLVAGDALLTEALAMAEGAGAAPRDLLIRTKNSLRLAESSSHAAAVTHETAEQARSLRQPPFRALVSRLRASIATR